MKHLCTTCEIAVWRRTEAGRLHPGGTGKCGWKFEDRPIPAAFSWVHQPPRPVGGHISRNPTRTGDKPIEECAFYREAAK